MPEHTEWKDIPGYEGWYQASRCGKIRRLRTIYNGQGKLPAPNVRELSPLWYRKGYYKVHLGSCGGTRPMSRQYIHRVIYRTFHGEIPEGMTVNHIDGSHDNNHADNLELATHAEQHHHARELGIIRNKTNAGHKRPTLTEDDVLTIRATLTEAPRGPKGGYWYIYRTLGEQYGVNDSTICCIHTRHTWKHI
jgi:hypothetical protein